MVLKVSRRGQVPPFIVMDVMREAALRVASGKDVVHLEVGQPGGRPPRAVLEAAKRALEDDSETLGYTLALGHQGLRERIARFYKESHRIKIDADRVVVTTGSSGAFLLAFLAAFEAGDRVALAAPGYPAYRNILTALGCEVVTIPVDGATHFHPTPAHLEALDRPVDGLIVASPSNPTGSMLSPHALKALAEWCHGKGVRLVSDEIYHGIVYGEPAATALGFSDSAIVVNSFSKYYALTGWRLGWMVVPPELVRSVECLAQNLTIAPPTLSQISAMAVFDATGELDARVAGYAANRALLLDRLPALGFDKLAPADGAFYLYADIGHLTNDSPQFCKRILAECGVALTPGTDFDPLRGHLSVRFSLAGPMSDMEEAVRRLARVPLQSIRS
ncbi:MAG: aminotransferase class I/II-fold pyridoxal phosphate-dependent enzyme [Alphaproteobacteria bacterium]|nr:aminotransferase class I/II-fold pyridoxal phosphate-dependent enzyme [Alphaproteobacteria bacterium]